MQFPAAHAAFEQSPEICDHFELMLTALAGSESADRNNPGPFRSARHLHYRGINDNRAAPPALGHPLRGEVRVCDDHRITLQVLTLPPANIPLRRKVR